MRTSIWGRLALALICLIGLAGCGRNRLGSNGGADDNGSNAQAAESLVRGTPANGSIESGGQTRTFVYYVPKNAPGGPLPLVFMLHGGGGWGEHAMAMTTAGRWNELADEHGFAVVYPDGLNHRWNDCRTDDRDPSGADDVGLVSDLIDYFAARLPIDPARVYVAGHSNGGMMAFRIGLELNNRVAAVFSASGSLALHSECPAPQPISVMYMIGTADPIMPFAGGRIVIPGLRDQGEVISAEDTVKFWADSLGFNDAPAVTALPDRSADDGSTVTLTRYAGGANGAELRYYRVDGGGHSLPGSATMPKNGAKNADISAVDEAWDFFADKRLSHP